MADLKSKDEYQSQLMDVLPNENYPLFVAKSDIAEEINPGVIELGCFSACVIPENEHFATYVGKAIFHYDARSSITEDDKQFYLISHTNKLSGQTVTINGFDNETKRGYCYMSYANDGLTRREANAKMEYESETGKFKFYALKSIQPWEEILWEYDHSGIWWLERRNVLPEPVYQEAVRKYSKTNRTNFTFCSGEDDSRAVEIISAVIDNTAIVADLSNTVGDALSDSGLEDSPVPVSNSLKLQGSLKSKKSSVSEAENVDSKYNKPMFPRSYYAKDVLIEYDANVDTRIIENGLEILQSRYAYEIASEEENISDINSEIIYYYVYQIAQMIDEAMKLESKATLMKSVYKDLSPAGIELFLKNIRLLDQNFQNFTNSITSTQKYLLFKSKQSDSQSKYYSEKYDLRFNLIDNDIDPIWKYLNRLHWQDLISQNSKNPSGPHFISRLTCVRILYTIRKYFKYIYEFKNFADIGVGIPYLAACVKSFYSHVNVCGIDLKEIIDAIKNKLSVIRKEDSILTEIAFRECNIMNAHFEQYQGLMQYLKDCEVITNFIGRIDTNEAFIKYVLPKSSCKLIMFRTRNIKFPALHHQWLKNMGYQLFPVQLKGTLALQVLYILFIIT